MINVEIFSFFRHFLGKLQFSTIKSQFLVIKSTFSSSSNQSLIVYKGPLIGKIKALKYLSLTTSMISLAAQPIIILKANEIGSGVFAAVFASSLGAIVFLTPFLINLVTKRYVYQVDFEADSKRFTAYTLNILNRPVRHIFGPGDVRLLKEDKMFANATINQDKAFFIDFKKVTDYDALHLMLMLDDTSSKPEESESKL